MLIKSNKLNVIVIVITSVFIIGSAFFNKNMAKEKQTDIDKNTNQITIYENDNVKTISSFGGRSDGIFDNKTVFANAAAWLKDEKISGKKLVIPSGRYFTSERINFTGIKNCTIDVQGEIVSTNGIIFSGDEITATFKQITGDTKTSVSNLKNVVIYITATTNSDIKIDRITGYKNAVMLVGDALLTPRGVLYTTVDVGKIIRSDTACLITTVNSPFGATSAKAGFVNENIIRIRWMDTNYGISFVKGPNQYDRFNNNKIEYAGLEHIANDGISMEFSMGNLIYETRGEDVKGLIFKEKDCYGNKYIISVPIKLDKIKLDRSVSYMGLLTDEYGTPFSHIYMTDSYGKPSYISTGGVQSLNDRGNSIRPSVNVINAHATKPLEIIMSKSREFEGSTVYINATTKNDKIIIKNSNSNVDIADIGEGKGVYLLMYYEGKWHSTKLSDMPFKPS